MEGDIPKINTLEPEHQQEEAGSILVPQIKFSEDGKKISPSGKKISKKKKRILILLASIFGALLIVGVVLGLLWYRVYVKARVVEASARTLVAAANEQDLPKIKQELQNTKSSLNDFSSTYNSVVWMKVFPYFGMYVKDGRHAINAAQHGIEAAEITVVAIEPYADIIGFSGAGNTAQDGAQTAQERLDFVVTTIPGLIPKADELTQKVALIQKEIDQIDPERYPEKFQGKEIRANLREGKNLIDLTATLVKNGKPLLEAAPYLLGVEEERQYLVLFQNDKEERATGGFLTAYSIAKVKKGKFEPVSSSDIYNLDASYKPRIAAPEPIIKYLKGPYILSKNYRLRDINWSPDFEESMELFLKEAQTAGIRDVDGIIAVDTQVLVNILDVIGPIGVSGFGEFSTKIIPECNCPQVIYELESFADVEGAIVWSQDEPDKIIFAPPNYENRKKIIGPLMNSVLSNALGQPKEKVPALFEAVFKSILEKHVLVYVTDEASQKAVKDFGIGGNIREYEGDYLHINDSNLGGRKSNLYVTQEVAQEINVAKDGSVEKTVTITYKNPEKHDGWLNSVLPNWLRVYVPKGSELISMEGLEEKDEPYEELGKTVFAGYFQLRPQGVAKVIVKYKLPIKFKDQYKLLVQKQPSKAAPLYTITLGKFEEELFLRTDREFSLSL